MTTLPAALGDLLRNPDLTVEEAVDRHFSLAFRQRTNGAADDRASFVAKIAQLRADFAEVTVTVLDELNDGDRYAEHHVIDLVGHDGGHVTQEVFVFARLDPDGRFATIDESAFPVSRN